MIVQIEVTRNKAYRYSKLLFYALLHLLDLKLSKQIIGRFLTKSKQIIGRFLTKSKEIIGRNLTKSKEIISPDLNNCDLLPILISANDILTDDI